MAPIEDHALPAEGSSDSDHGSTAASVTEELRGQILDGQFAPGQRLGQEMLASRFNASRMPVRTALSQLESEGLVTTVAHSGAWVSQLDRFEFEQVYKMREALEPLAIAESIPNLTQQNVEEIVSVSDKLHDAILPTVKIEDFLSLDRQFHLLTYGGVLYKPLRLQVERLWNTTQHYRRALAYRFDEDKARMTDHDHALIVDAVRRRDTEAARALVRLHIHRTRLTLDSSADIFS